MRAWHTVHVGSRAICIWSFVVMCEANYRVEGDWGVVEGGVSSGEVGTGWHSLAGGPLSPAWAPRVPAVPSASLSPSSLITVYSASVSLIPITVRVLLS